MNTFKVKDREFSSGTHIMGIINVTPDSFYAGSRVDKNVIEVAMKMINDGAEILDIGGQSTRPDAKPVPVFEELARVIPAVEQVRKALPDAVISVDTTSSLIARAAIEAGADMINDVSGLQDEEMAQLISETGVSVCAMHTRRESVIKDIHLDKIVGLQEIVQKLRKAGVPDEKILLDAGIGFNKNSREDWQLFEDYRNIMEEMEFPFLLGASRKTFLGGMPETRLSATLDTTARACKDGILFVRVHDVKENRQIIEVYCG
ncbi:MAG: dihydropteroate synthase [Clostridia bacterium]|nr:dihydropteroate synthase [Clostridia bacterium]